MKMKNMKTTPPPQMRKLKEGDEEQNRINSPD